MKIATIIPTFNRQKELSDLLSMLGNMNMPDDYSVDIIVVVDGSTDGTLEALAKNSPGVHVVKGTGNWWYTKSINEGMRYAEVLNPDLILTLNDDIILPKEYLQKLIHAYSLKEPESIVGSISFTHDAPHRITNSGVRKINRLLDRTENYLPFLTTIDPSQAHGIYPTPVLPGRGMLIPWKVAKKLNFFDENFIQYQSDFDFTLRALREGFQVYISWDAQVFGMLQKTNSGSSFLKPSWKIFLKNFFNPYSRSYIPNRARYYWRHYHKPLWPWYMIKYTVLLLIKQLFKRKPDSDGPKTSSHTGAILKLQGTDL